MKVALLVGTAALSLAAPRLRSLTARNVRFTIGLGLVLINAACDREKRPLASDPDIEATALVALASDSATPAPSLTVVCFGVTAPGTRGGRPPSPTAWRRIRVAFPRARPVTDCQTPDTAVDIWATVLLDSLERLRPGEAVVWGTLVAEHANVWRCILRREHETWTATPCEYQWRAPQDRPTGPLGLIVPTRPIPRFAADGRSIVCSLTRCRSPGVARKMPIPFLGRAGT